MKLNSFDLSKRTDEEILNILNNKNDYVEEIFSMAVNEAEKRCIVRNNIDNLDQNILKLQDNSNYAFGPIIKICVIIFGIFLIMIGIFDIFMLSSIITMPSKYSKIVLFIFSIFSCISFIVGGLSLIKRWIKLMTCFVILSILGVLSDVYNIILLSLINNSNDLTNALMHSSNHTLIMHILLFFLYYLSYRYILSSRQILLQQNYQKDDARLVADEKTLDEGNEDVE